MKELSKEFEEKWKVDPDQFIEEDPIPEPAGPKQIDEKAGTDPNYEGYRSITLVFEKYFVLQQPKAKDEDNQRVFRQLPAKFDKMTISEVVKDLQDNYLAKDADGESKYPSDCIKLVTPKKLTKPIDGKTLVAKTSDTLHVKLFEVVHLNICN